ncbi:hypothetical protein P8C59_004697 [Phyllachora maydis]|uniref:F-box domain-containing protein n=1 Tax=Phyllachora maydis TaxID=1825666 RepID=A0AAD9I3Z7_9PEZI|nr:hypothetical protein P8C59_004697 [Phyllachora maydis]
MTSQADGTAELDRDHALASAPPSPPLPDDVDSHVVEVQPKRTGRQRLLRGLQRISSSPSLSQSVRPRSAAYGHRNLSCVSLASSPSPFGHPSGASFFSRSSAGVYSSAPTSMSGSPIAEYPDCDGLVPVLAVRRVKHAVALSSTAALPAELRRRRTLFSLWTNMPHEIKIQVLSYFSPKELVRISRVNKAFYSLCFDGQLWTSFDASDFYRQIPAESLAKIIVAAGPFVKDLNLRGCVQVEHYKRAEVVVKACRNLINATLEGCRNFQRSTLHSLLRSNEKLAVLNLTGLAAVTNTTCKIIAQSCPQLELFNVSWCKHMDARGIKTVLEGCPALRDLRAGEIKGFDDHQVAQAIFKKTSLERLVLAGCEELDDAAFRIMMHGTNPELDVLTDRPLVPCRRLKHLDLSRCHRLTAHGVTALGHFVPDLEGLQLSGVTALTDAALEPILATTPRLTHLELEDLGDLTDTLLKEHLAKAPCAPHLEHLSISSCENLSDVGMVPVIRRCTSLRSIDMDNTRISDLVLTEAAAMVRDRAGRTTDSQPRPRPHVGLSLVIYDCQLVTWTGVLEVLSRNAEVKARPSSGNNGDAKGASLPGPSYPAEIILLKCFYGWQMTVDEHTKRVLRGDLGAASRLERKWADYMQANEEAGAGGAGGRRRRRRAREAQMVHADEEEGGVMLTGRRRARTTQCSVMQAVTVTPPPPSSPPSHPIPATEDPVSRDKSSKRLPVMSAPQDSASNGGDLADSIDQLKLADNEQRLGPDGEPAPKTDDEYAATQLTLRAVVSTKEAGVIIGKGGKNVADLRDETGVKAGVSKVVQGVHDRVLTITGGCDAISRAYAVVARALLEGAPAMGMGGVMPTSGTHSIKLLISHNQMGTIIGRQGLKIKNIQDVSGVRMVAQKEMLPQSTERIVEVQGPPDGIQRAVWEICKCLVDDWQRATGTVLYNPVVRTQTGGAVAGLGAAGPGAGAGVGGGGYGQERGGYGAGSRIMRTGNGADFSNGGQRSYNRRSDSDAATRGPPTHDENGEEIQTQNISIPADMVGCIIGRAGSKISDIRKTSGARISIAKAPHDETGERMFTIMGTAKSNETALFLLYENLEAEKMRRQQQAAQPSD